ncbi:50S ribosomal protein L24 [Paludibaculum fermentans]|uniref:50S ribosomal protein L24 n=1 Tax=Paludibaculum fermentans TaxID=1473598 RepID=UPI003EB6C6D8
MAGRLANRHNEPKEVVKIRFRKNDTVKVIAGKDKGKVGRVLEVNRETGRILVEGVQMSKKHIKPNPGQGIKGGIAERESPIHASNVMIVTNDGHTSRIGVKVETVGGKTRRVRIARKTGETLDKK